jgi:small subunit ribosomal protein S4e
MLDKLSGVFAPRPSAGPHKLRECLPLVILLRNRLKYALTRREVTLILMQRLISVDGKVRTDASFPTGFMDVIKVDRTDEHFRLLYDVKGRFVLHRVLPQEAAFKLCRVKKVGLLPRGIPYIGTHDGRTIRYPHPDIRVNDVVKIDLATGKIITFVKFNVGNLSMTTGGRNIGRVGIIFSRLPHPGSEEIVKVRDSRGHIWSTLASNIFVLGNENESLVSLPKDKGVRLSVIEERDARAKKH